MSQTNTQTIIAVDGPAGSGKSSVCIKSCEKMGWSYLNTGAIYRAVALLGLRDGVDLNSEDAVLSVVDKLINDFDWDAKSNSITYKGEDLSDQLTSEELGRNASKIARYSKVREQLIPVQREIINSAPGIVLVDGRDIGTVIVPDAPIKIFMTASLEARAARRQQQLVATGQLKSSQNSAQSIREGIEKRDNQDSKRGVAPLVKADDAILFDTSEMDLEEAINNFISLIDSKL